MMSTHRLQTLHTMLFLIMYPRLQKSKVMPALYTVVRAKKVSLQGTPCCSIRTDFSQQVKWLKLVQVLLKLSEYILLEM